MTRGSLTIVGIGYRVCRQVTAEAEECMRAADRLFHLTSDSLTETWLTELNATATTLVDCYREGEPGVEALERMSERATAPLRLGLEVCVAFPGHPTIFVSPCQRMVARARAGGHAATILPGVSAIDCLFADLGIDPAVHGWQVFEATNLLLRRHRLDPFSSLIVLQIGSIGLRTYHGANPHNEERLAILAEFLQRSHAPDHEVILYEIPPYPICAPRLQRLPLSRLPEAEVGFDTTLYVPPRPPEPADPVMLARLAAARPPRSSSERCGS